MRFFHRLRQLKVELSFIIVTLICFRISAELELFERFYDFSRAHENWELDEIAVLSLNVLAALLCYLVLHTKTLSRTVKERDMAELEAQRIARHDSLTGLANRRAYTSHLAKCARSGNLDGLMVMMIDLDRFKAINDLHGHACGDFVLSETAKRLQAELGPGDFVARLGGDEFAIALAPGASAEMAESVARRIAASVASPFIYNEIKLSIGSSIGLACLEKNLEPSSALHCADQALYCAKKNGRGHFAWYDAQLDSTAKERRILEQDLRQAVRDGDIDAHFQPVFDIKNNQLCGFEALARWEHKTRGMISPDIFISIADDIGLIAPLGWSILTKACLAAREWDASLRLAVNFSPTQFRDAHLVSTVKDVLIKTQFDPRRLEIEVTESAIMLDFELAKKSIRELRQLGVTLALDDFGTGFSSLSNLRQLPFDRIKIDQSFVSDISENPENQKIVAGILAMAQGLNLSVTAEGIASNDDLSFLQGVNCPLGQGFLFSQPMTAEETDWLLETKWSELYQRQTPFPPQDAEDLPKAG